MCHGVTRDHRKAEDGSMFKETRETRVSAVRGPGLDHKPEKK